MSDRGLILTIPDELIERVARRAAELVAERESTGDRWLSTDEAARYLATNKGRLYALCSAGRIPFVKDGSRTLFRRSALDAWLEAGGGKRP